MLREAPQYMQALSFGATLSFDKSDIIIIVLAQTLGQFNDYTLNLLIPCKLFKIFF